MTMEAIGGLIQDEASDHLNKQVEDSSAVNKGKKPELIKISDPTITIPDPKLVLPEPAYGELSYAMGVMNQARMDMNHFTKIHDLPSMMLDEVAKFMKPSLASNVIEGVNNVRTQIRTVIYGDREERIAASKELAEEVAMNAAMAVGVGVVGKVAVEVLPMVSEVGFFGRSAEGGESVANYGFKAGEDVIHFGKHSPEFIETFGYKNYSLEEYVKHANLVIKNGTYVPELNGYVAVAGGKGGAKGIFVGLDRATNEITTLHLKPVSFFERKAPSLGWQSKPQSELTDLIGPDRELGWKSPYRRK